ncbi:TrkA family potassium uptake protein [Parabacteroides sp. AM08-6]|uniref:potassium channel family protein n=1 Tax=Parabacteroides sp. AM08-6 TaxID=2292053 RepID=UPI000F006E0B|nr:TrkA family potassium uptake protein [Parabacteroides sp. AM08-6]RHJ83193.1 TrkA family potassium uptake protein [Parabacteroides sp. AM08-6]
MKYLVIGLGNLGRAIAESLTQIGNEVIGVDVNPHKIEAVKHTISGAICLDTTDKEALNTLPLNEMDAIFVTFGKDFGTSIQTVAFLKNLDVNKIIVRGISPIHEAVIRSIGVTEIITPEDDFAGMYASQSLLGELFKQWYKVTETHHLYKIKAPATFVGQTLKTINLEENFGIRLAGIERAKVERNLIGIKQKQYSVISSITGDITIEEDDLLILFGEMEVLHKLAEI